MPDRNRTITDSGVRLSGNLLEIPPIEDLGVTPEDALAIAAPLIAFIDSLPYYLDEQNQLAYKSSTIAINHTPILEYGPGHPDEGDPIMAKFNDGAYATRYGGAPMPFIDMDMIGPVALKQLLIVLNEIAAVQASAT
jgi:hypothetical protein